MIKKLIKKLYFKLFPDRADISKESLAELEAAIDYSKRPDYTIGIGYTKYVKHTLQADWNIQKEEYEICKHNPDYMTFVKERIALNLVKGIEDKIKINTEFNVNTVRIVGRLDLWEEE